MAPSPKSSGNSGNKNPHLRMVHGKYRFNANTNVPTNHASCMIGARSKIDKEHHRKFGTPPKVYTSNAKGMFS